MISPPITVFMTVFNSDRFLANAIGSVFSQTFKDFELLIVNDGSTDNTSQVLASFDDPRIRVINNNENRGILFSRNIALSQAKGRYIAVLDADDIALPDRLEIQYNFLENNETTAACGGHAYLIDEAGKMLNRVIHVKTSNLAMHLMFRNVLVHSATMFRSSVFRELSGYRLLNYAEDYDFFCRVTEKYEVANIDRFLIKYREHSANTSKMFLQEMVDSERFIISGLQCRLGLEPENRFIDIQHSILTNQFIYSYNDYLAFFVALKASNVRSRVFLPEAFNKFLYEEWATIIEEKGGSGSFRNLFSGSLLDRFDYLTFRRVRRVFKKRAKVVLGLA